MLMAEISEPSEPPPEAPEGVKWVHWLWHHFTQEGEVIRKAPLAFVVTVSAAGLLIFAMIQWRVSGEISLKDATIENQKAHISILEEETKGIAPQQAAINIKRRKLIEILQEFYVVVGPIITRPLPADISETDFNKYMEEANTWINNCANWIGENMGVPARERFLDRTGMLNMTSASAVNVAHNNVIQNLTRLRQNLLVLVESGAWDKVESNNLNILQPDPFQLQRR